MVGDTKPFQNEFRPKLLNHIYNDLNKGETSTLICLSGIGKTNAIHWIKKHLSKNKSIITIHVDLENIISHTETSFYKLLLLELKESIKQLEKREELTEFSKQVYDKNITNEDPLVIFYAIKDIFEKVLENTDLSLCVIFDAYENVDKVEDSIFQSLNVLRKLNKYRVVYLLVSNQDLLDQAENQVVAELLANFNKHWLPFLTEKETIKLAEEFAALSSINLTENQKKAIWKLSGGHAWLIKSLTKLFAEGNITSKTSEAAILNKGNIRIRLEHIWDTINENERKQLVKALDSNEEIENLSLLLKKLNVIEFEGDRYKFFSPLFKLFVEQNKEGRGEENYKILQKQEKPEDASKSLKIDSKSMTVSIGNKTIDSFTKSEFKLLEYLSKHSGEVISRDDIADAVWGDNSDEKYSDWAIDKLVSRLRDKIEEDSRHPEFLKTIRGVGYKFTDS